MQSRTGHRGSHSPPAGAAASGHEGVADPTGAPSPRDLTGRGDGPYNGPMRDALDEPTGPGGPSTQSSTGLLERTEVEQEKSPGDGDRFAHFVRRDKADSSMVTGQPVVALCGKVWIPTRDASQYPVCPTCKELRDSMGKNGRNWPFSDGGKPGSGE